MKKEYALLGVRNFWGQPPDFRCPQFSNSLSLIESPVKENTATDA